MMKLISETTREFRTDKKAGKQFVAPTSEEMNNLRESELLFKSNLFRLQVNELLNEVKVNRTKTTVIEKSLVQLKSSLDNLPSKLITQNEINSYVDIILQNVKTNNTDKITFKFEKPTKIDVVGSFLLGTTCKPILNIDLAITMPSTMFGNKDYLNFIYLDKRSIYLRTIANYLNNSNKENNKYKEIKMTTYRGDINKPILLLFPNKNEDGITTKFIIRIFPVIDSNVFKLNKLLPSKNNNRRIIINEQDKQPKTPNYNTSIIEDTIMKNNLEYIHKTINECPLLVDSILLLKVWLRQRNFHKANDSINGFLLSMLICHLFNSKLVTKHMSSYQMIKVTLQFIAKHNLKDGIFIANSNNNTNNHKDENRIQFLENFGVVIVDPSGYVNIASRVTINAWEDLKYESNKSIKYLNDPTVSGFDSLFITPVNFNLKFDTYLRINKLPVIPEDKSIEEMDLLCDKDWFTIQLEKIHNVLKDGLNDRVQHMRIIRHINNNNNNNNDNKENEINDNKEEEEEEETWKIGENKYKKEEKKRESIFIGIQLDSIRARSVMEVGPSPQDEINALKFKSIWGNKAELRRFKDGRIILCVVWELPDSQKHLVLQKSISYLLYRHLKLPKTNLYFIGDQFDSLITMPGTNYNNNNSNNNNNNSGGDKTYQLVQTADKLSKILKLEITKLPLQIMNVQGIASALRYTSVFPELPVTQQITIGQYKYVFPLKLIIQFESSGSWPSDLHAIRNLKTAFYLQLSNLLSNQFHIRCIPHLNHLNVYFEGYLFQLIIYYHKEVTLLLEDKNNNNNKILGQEYEKMMVNKTQIHSAIHSFHLRNANCYGTSVRIVKRWFNCHLFTDYISDELIELLVCYIFLNCQPYSTPVNHLVAFLRFLNFLSTFDFQNNPVIVDFDKQFTSEDINNITLKFNEIRKEDKDRAIYIVTNNDRESIMWSKDKPTKQILKRIVAFAKQSYFVLMNQFLFDKNETNENRTINWKSIFKTPLNDYNVIIHLDHNQIPQYQFNIKYSLFEKSRNKLIEKINSQNKNFKNVSNVETIIGMNPIKKFINELQIRYNDKALFFYDGIGGDVIGVVWKPNAFIPRPFTVADSIGSLPASQSQVKSSMSTKKNKLHTLPNVDQIVHEFKIIGQGLVSDVTINSSPPEV